MWGVIRKDHLSCADNTVDSRIVIKGRHMKASSRFGGVFFVGVLALTVVAANG